MKAFSSTANSTATVYTYPSGEPLSPGRPNGTHHRLENRRGDRAAPPPHPFDVAEAQRFAVKLDPDAQVFLFATGDDAGERRKRLIAEAKAENKPKPILWRHRRGSVQEVQRWIEEQQENGWGVFVSVQAMKASKCRIAELAYIRVVYAEMDIGEPLKPWPIEPNIIVETSAGRYHVYWLVLSDEPITAEDFNGIMMRLVETYGSDPDAKDLARRLRMPGTWNVKPGRPPHPVRIIHDSGVRYTRTKLLEAFPPPPRPKPSASAARPRFNGHTPPDLERFVGKIGDGPIWSIRPDQYGDWLRVGMALHAETGGGSGGLALWDRWSAASGSDKWAPGVCEEKWKSFGGRSGINGGTIFHMARGRGWVESKWTDAKKMSSQKQERAANTADRTAADTERDAEGDGAAADEAMKEGAADKKKERRSGSTDRQSQATMLAAIAMDDDVELFRTPEGDAYADIRIDGHRETWKVNSKGFRYWLRGAYFEQTGTAVGNDATTSALDIVEAQAQFGGAVREVHLRVAEHDGRIYINRANSKWQAVEISPGAWRVVDEPPVRFVRKYGMLELPEPVRGGSVAKLREHLRVQDEGFSLIIAWLLAALRPRGPYPVLALTGEQGTAKSTTLRMLRCLVDPNAAPLRAPPDSVKDLYVAAINGHVITFDNVSYLSGDVSDAMCRLSTGGGFSARALYTDDEEKLFDGQRPQGVNGIGAVVSRPDLLERTLGVQLETIPDDARKLEEDLWAAFNAARPAVLGALYDAVAHGLKLLPEVRPNRLPRMADFARWSVACETAYQKPGTFMMAYGGYIDEAAHIALESDILAQSLMDYMRQQRRGEDGHREVDTTSGALLDTLTAFVGEQKSRNKLWPKSPEGMAAKLTRLAPVLRKIGITLERQPREPGTGRRLVTIRDVRPLS